MESLRKTRTFHQASCFKVTRNDGEILLLTDADGSLVLADGDTYLPMGAAGASARRKQVDLEDQSVEFVGVLTSDRITHADLASGKYRGAKVDFYLVDKRHPWAGHWHHQVYWMKPATFDHETWSADVEGFAGLLSQEIGDVASIYCKHEVGEAFGLPDVIGCHADISSLTLTSVSVSSVNGTFPRSKFRNTTHLIPGVDGDYKLGKATWLTGANAGHASRIRSNIDVSGDEEFELFLETPFDIQVGDTFELKPGCNKLAGVTEGDTTGHCKNRYSQIEDFGGDPYIPGTGKMLRRPL